MAINAIQRGVATSQVSAYGGGGSGGTPVLPANKTTTGTAAGKTLTPSGPSSSSSSGSGSGGSTVASNVNNKSNQMSVKDGVGTPTVKDGLTPILNGGATASSGSPATKPAATTTPAATTVTQPKEEVVTQPKEEVVTQPKEEVVTQPAEVAPAPETETTATSQPVSVSYRTDTSALRDVLSAWQNAATAQKQSAVDYAVGQSVAELERALADAQAQYKEQAESVAIDERQAMDNAALYAEARGDNGGIGQSQYNEIQAAAAKNRLAVQQSQTKLASDTARQIADLRARGEFEKADAALEVSQEYLGQLMQLEQWAAEYGLSEAQFRESLNQWQKEYQLAVDKFTEEKNQWKDEYQLATDKFNEEKNQWQSEHNLNAEKFSYQKIQDALDAAYTADQLTAQNAQTREELYGMLRDAGVTTANGAKAQLALWGISNPSNYTDDYMTWYRANKGTEVEDGVKITGLDGTVSWSKAEELEKQGSITMVGQNADGSPIYVLSHWTAMQ